MTTKMSWNLTNIFPHHTFNWQGIDGSCVLVHMPPDGTYNSSAAPRALVAAEKNFADKAVSEHAMLVFGIGDGGGGPGEEHLERLQRERNLDGLPAVIQEFTSVFFERLEVEESTYQTWRGELFLERHVGTFTTQARNKWFNRKMELALRDLEFLATFANVMAGMDYPRGELITIWREMLLYQFHDILPGSSIARVYDECLARYAVLMEQVTQLMNAAEQQIATHINSEGVSEPFLVFNTLSWSRREWIKYNEKWIEVGVPAMGLTVVDSSLNVTPISSLTASDSGLENEVH